MDLEVLAKKMDLEEKPPRTGVPTPKMCYHLIARHTW